MSVEEALEKFNTWNEVKAAYDKGEISVEVFVALIEHFAETR